MTFTPRLDVLPDAQRALWPALSEIPDSCVLYGGTALALRLGHRASVDFDFFSSELVDFDALFALPFAAEAEVLQRTRDTLTLSTDSKDVPVGWRTCISRVFHGMSVGGHVTSRPRSMHRRSLLSHIFSTTAASEGLGNPVARGS